MKVRINETSITNYRLRAFNNSSDPDFIKGVKLYAQNIDVTSLTNTNEISYCLDKYNEHYNDSIFVVAGFYQNKQLIGYCQFIYLKNEKLIIVDYLVIDELYRGLNVFYTFIEKIKELIQLKNFEIQYLVGEINIPNSSKDKVPDKTLLLVNLLKRNNFGEIKTAYHQPMLGIDNYESAQKSILMLYPANQYQTIKKETFLKIITAIYFKHYERWYKLFLTENELIKYSKHLHELYNKVSQISEGKLIDIIGDSDLFGEVNLKVLNKTTPKKTALVIIGFICLLILLSVFAILMKTFWGIELKDQLILLSVTSILYLLLLSLFSEKAAKILNRIIEKAIDKLT